MSNIRISAELPIEDRQHNIKRFLQLVGSEHRVHFEFSGPPRTDGRTVWLGDPEADAFEVLALGHGLHEMLHVAETDMDWFTRLQTGRLERDLFNMLEDVRIDTIGMHRFAAYRAWRAELMELHEAGGRLRTAADPRTLSAADLIVTWLHAELLSELNVSWALRHRDRLRARIDAQVGKKHPDLLLRIARQIHRTRDSQETFRVAATLARRIKDFSEEEEKDSATSLATGKTPSPQRFFQTVLIETQKESDEDTPETTSPKPREASGKQILGLWPTQGTNARLIADASEYGPLFRNRLERLQRLTQRFEELLRIRTDGDEAGAEYGDGFCTDFVSRIASNDRRVFQRTVSHDDVHAHCVLLIDRSGSMGLERMTCAKVAYAALTLALEKTPGVKTTCAAFPGIERTALLSLKHENERASVMLQRIEGLGAFGSTPMAEALDWARTVLCGSDRALRLVVLITDGVYPLSRIEETVRKYKEDRIELAVLNIDTENPGLCENTVSVSKTEDIESALLTLMRQAKTMRAMR